MNTLLHTRIEPEIKKEIELVVKNNHFSSTSEFIKDAIRKHLEHYKRQEILETIHKHLGKQKEKTLTKEMKAQAAQEALHYKGDIFKDLGLK